jgi:ankyrin repeat protein
MTTSPVTIKSEEIQALCKAGNKDALQKAIKSNGRKVLSYQDTLGWTPAHSCAVFGKTECLRIVLEHGGHPGLLTVSRQSPLHLAALNLWRHSSAQCFYMLLAAGCPPDALDHRNSVALSLLSDSTRARQLSFYDEVRALLQGFSRLDFFVDELSSIAAPLDVPVDAAGRTLLMRYCSRWHVPGTLEPIMTLLGHVRSLFDNTNAAASPSSSSDSNVVAAASSSSAAASSSSSSSSAQSLLERIVERAALKMRGTPEHGLMLRPRGGTVWSSFSSAADYFNYETAAGLSALDMLVHARVAGGELVWSVASDFGSQPAIADFVRALAGVGVDVLRELRYVGDGAASPPLRSLYHLALSRGNVALLDALVEVAAGNDEALQQMREKTPDKSLHPLCVLLRFGAPTLGVDALLRIASALELAEHARDNLDPQVDELPLFAFARRNHLGVGDSLIVASALFRDADKSAGRYVDTPDSYGDNALMMAAARPHLATMQSLIMCGASVLFQSRRGETVLAKFVSGVQARGPEHGASLSANALAIDEIALFLSAFRAALVEQCNGDKERAVEWLNAVRGPHHRTLGFVALERGEPLLLAALIELGVDVPPLERVVGMLAMDVTADEPLGSGATVSRDQSASALGGQLRAARYADAMLTSRAASLGNAQTADLLFAVSDRLFPAHRVVVCPVSPLLESLCNNDDNKNDDDESKMMRVTVELDDANVFAAILFFVYTGKAPFKVPRIRSDDDVVGSEQIGVRFDDFVDFFLALLSAADEFALPSLHRVSIGRLNAFLECGALEPAVALRLYNALRASKLPLLDSLDYAPFSRYFLNRSVFSVLGNSLEPLLPFLLHDFNVVL